MATPAYERLVDHLRTQSKTAPGSDTDRVTIRSLDDATVDAMTELLDALDETVEPGTTEYVCSPDTADRVLTSADADGLDELESRLGRPVRTEDGCPTTQYCCSIWMRSTRTKSTRLPQSSVERSGTLRVEHRWSVGSSRGKPTAHRNESTARRCSFESSVVGRSMWTPISPESARRPTRWTGSGAEYARRMSFPSVWSRRMSPRQARS